MYNKTVFWLIQEARLDREKFISQLNTTEKDIDKTWIMDVLKNP